MCNNFKFIILCLFIANFISCVTFKRNATKSSNTNYETFYVNDSTMQYFIKPIGFINNNEVLVDFTFRKTKSEFSEVTMNFSYLSQNKSNIEKLVLICGNIRYSYPIKKTIYKETKNSKFIYRYNAIINFTDLHDFFLSADHSIEINNEILKPSAKVIKKINIIKANLFEFELINE